MNQFHTHGPRKFPVQRGTVYIQRFDYPCYQDYDWTAFNAHGHCVAQGNVRDSESMALTDANIALIRSEEGTVDMEAFA